MNALHDQSRQALLARIEALDARVRTLEAERDAVRASDPPADELRSALETYQTLLNRLDHGFCIVQMRFDESGRATDYRFLEVNDVFGEQTGIRDARGRWMRDIAPHHEEHWFERYGRVARTGQDVRFQDVSQELQRFFDVYAFPVGDPREHKVGILFADISRQKQAEDALRESRERLQAAVHGGDLGVWDLDLRTGVAVRSPRHDEIWGYAVPVAEWGLEAAMGQVVPEDRPLIEAAYAEGIRSGVLSHESRIVWPDGSIHWIAATGRFRYDEEGRPVRVSGVVADITGRKRAEEEMRRARETAERASRAKSQFLAVTSHELRTPLNAIVGFHDLLALGLRGPLTDPQMEFLDRIKRSADDLLGIIDEILDAARMESGSEALELEEAEIGAMARQTVSLLEPAAAEKGLELRAELPPDPLTLRTDVQKLCRILLNLLSNAVRFTDNGGVGLRVGTDATGRCVVAEVSDTGRGIPTEHHDWIFEPFTQLDPFNTRTHRGTGLGLSIARSYARLLGGDLTVRSEPGAGSTFTLELPREGPPGGGAAA